MKVRLFTIWALAFFLIAGTAWADDSSKSVTRLDKKFGRMASLILQNRDSLQLTDTQIQNIKDLKKKVKKNAIRRDAEIDLIDVDIVAKMAEDVIDSDAVSILIDQKFDIDRERERYAMDAFISLKESLKPEQLSNLLTLEREAPLSQEKIKEAVAEPASTIELPETTHIISPVETLGGSEPQEDPLARLKALKDKLSRQFDETPAS